MDIVPLVVRVSERSEENVVESDVLDEGVGERRVIVKVCCCDSDAESDSEKVSLRLSESDGADVGEGLQLSSSVGETDDVKECEREG